MTILTSYDLRDLAESLIISGDIEDLVTERARRSFLAAGDGFITSAHKAKRIRALQEAKGKLIVTLGIRPQGAA